MSLSWGTSDSSGISVVKTKRKNTAWTGWNPYDPNNSLFTSYYHDGNLDISVTEMKEPFVGGVGFGLRTTLFGYFVRGDMAWGIEDGKIAKKPQFYLSFNLDF